MFTSVFRLGLRAKTGLVSRGPHAESKGIVIQFSCESETENLTR